ncbi:MAG: sigma 54-interacting transcriptional regulator, partial [Polyangiales bacterium]
DHDTDSRIALDGRRQRSLCLLVMSQHGVFNHPLPERGSITIGRSEHCAVTIDDPKLSREHAILRIGDVVEIFDLDSSNGTRVGDKLIAPNVGTPLSPGDIFTVGGSLMVIQPTAASGARPRHLWSHAYFESRLEDECVRADETGRPFAVLRIRAASNTPAEVLVASLSAHVSPAHVIGCYVPGEYEALLVETPSAKADTIARELRAALGRSGVTVDIGVASYPHDGRTSESLVACAGARARAAVEGAPTTPPTSVAGRVLTDHGALHRLRPLVERFAAGTLPVLILGETGVGKEVLATMVHELGPRAGKPLVRLNCAALTETLLESELFGHERGAFTGAVQTKVGLLESGTGGTIFLDEVGEMPLSVQAKLLRVIEVREVIRVGSTKARPIDVRFVAATNRDLEAEVARGAFRQDLFYRLNGVAIVIPPLRERVAEIAPLTMSFVENVSRQLGKAPPRVSPTAMSLLKGYAWPGNVRELRNAVERAVLLAEDEIRPEHLPREKMHDMVLPEDSQRFMRSQLPAAAVGPGNYSAIQQRAQRRAETSRMHAVNADTPEGRERARIVDALERSDWNQTTAAKMLGVSRRTLVSRLTEYGLTRKRSPS